MSWPALQQRPEAASAASVLLPPISDFLSGVIGGMPECAQELAESRHSLLASVRQLLEGPSPFLFTGANVAARGSVVVGEAASTIFSALSAILWAGGGAYTDDTSRPAALLMQQCQALLADSTIAAQLRERQGYPFCSLTTGQQPNAVLLAHLVEGASELVIAHMDGIFNRGICRATQIGIVAASRQQLLALSAAVAQPARMCGSEVAPHESRQLPALATYKGAALLADVAMISAAALDDYPSLLCIPAGLAATVTSGAVAALAFAPFDSSSGRRPPNIEHKMPGCMQYATHAAKFLHVLAQQLRKRSPANAEAARSCLVSQGAAQSLVRLLLWLSEPTTAVATASGVLAEALPALQLMAADAGMRQNLAAADAPHAWEPVAMALRRRLPRRMAARFLPDLDHISAAVASHALGGVPVDAASIAAADAAMAELLLVHAARCRCNCHIDAIKIIKWYNCSISRPRLDCRCLSEEFDWNSELSLVLYSFCVGFVFTGHPVLPSYE